MDRLYFEYSFKLSKYTRCPPEPVSTTSPRPEGRPVLLNPKSPSHLSEAIRLKINPHIHVPVSLGVRSLLL